MTDGGVKIMQIVRKKRWQLAVEFIILFIDRYITNNIWSDVFLYKSNLNHFIVYFLYILYTLLYTSANICIII